jgi:hypothetical protein
MCSPNFQWNSGLSHSFILCTLKHSHSITHTSWELLVTLREEYGQNTCAMYTGILDRFVRNSYYLAPIRRIPGAQKMNNVINKWEKNICLLISETCTSNQWPLERAFLFHFLGRVLLCILEWVQSHTITRVSIKSMSLLSDPP